MEYTVTRPSPVSRPDPTARRDFAHAGLVWEVRDAVGHVAGHLVAAHLHMGSNVLAPELIARELCGKIRGELMPAYREYVEQDDARTRLRFRRVLEVGLRRVELHRRVDDVLACVEAASLEDHEYYGLQLLRNRTAA